MALRLPSVMVLLLAAGQCSADIAAMVAFADARWNCSDYSCTTRVHEGDWQPNYGCAPFVARVTAAGGFIPGLKHGDSDSVYSNFHYHGKTYNLDCTGSACACSQCAGSPGLADLMADLKFTKTSAVVAGTAVFVNGEGYLTHVQVGVGANIVDAHNNAQHRKPVCCPINLLYNPPATCTDAPDGSYCGPRFGLDPESLYVCQNGKLMNSTSCATGGGGGCMVDFEYGNDTCQRGVCTEDMEGYYCGSAVGGVPDAIYRCSEGRTLAIQPCAKGCKVVADADDQCKA